MTIGLFDSGLGGLTVVQALGARPLIYFGDTARVPYGGKSKETICRYAQEATQLLVDHGVTSIIVACNTATALALPELKSLFTTPIYGVIEPSVQAAVAATQNGRIGVIGTRSTIESGVYRESLQQQQSDLVVVQQACPLFVPLVEEHYLDHEVTRLIAKEYLQPLIEKSIDTLLLGCTHYPLLRSLIQEVVGDQIQVIDSATACAAQLPNTQETGNQTFMVSDDPDRFARIGSYFLGRPISHVTHLTPGSAPRINIGCDSTKEEQSRQPRGTAGSNCCIL